MSVDRSMIPDEAQRMELVLASARLFLVVAALVAIRLDPTEPARFGNVAYGLILLYLVFTVVAFLLVRFRPAAVRYRILFHAVDILWPATISIFTTGAASPFFLFYTFVLLAAAYRWGLRETIATAGVTVALFLSEGLLGLSSSRLAFFLEAGGLDLNRFLMRSIYLLIFGYLLGYLGEEEKLLRHESWAITRLIGLIQSARGLAAAMEVLLAEIVRTFRADSCLLALANEITDEAILWRYENQVPGDGTGLSRKEISRQERALYLFSKPWAVCHGTRTREGFDVHALDRRGNWTRERWSPPPGWLEGRSFEAFLAVGADYGREWSGNLVLLGGRHFANDRNARRLETLAAQTAPAVYGVYLRQRLRARAGAAERARVARELHDGVIQSLIGIEMQVDVLRRRPPQADTVPEDLARVQQLLRQEVQNVRELIEQVRPFDIRPRQLAEYLAALVDKFGRDSGIIANFTCSVEEMTLRPRVCHEVARITQEGLVNARRHSGARHVVVSLGQDDGRWKLVIDDDGRGFGFSGRLTQAELDAGHKGPVVIKERVRALGGDLLVDSRPGEGSRLEIWIPKDTDVD